MGKPVKTLYAITCSIIYATKTRPACANQKIWNQQLWIHKLNLKCILKMKPYSILRKNTKRRKKKKFFFFKKLNQMIFFFFFFFFSKSRNRSSCFTIVYTTCLYYSYIYLISRWVAITGPRWSNHPKRGLSDQVTAPMLTFVYTENDGLVGGRYFCEKNSKFTKPYMARNIIDIRDVRGTQKRGI